MKSDPQAFLSMFATPTPSNDRRRSNRQPTGTLATLSRATAGADLNSFHVFVVNTSNTGLGLRSPIPLARGTIYRVQMNQDPPTPVSNIRVVTSRKRPDGSYEIGARYV